MPAPVNVPLLAGVSVTAAVITTSVLDRTRPKSRSKPALRSSRASIPAPKSASQETPFVVGNMVLATF